MTHVRKGTGKACHTSLGPLMNLLFFSGAQAPQKGERWQKLLRQIPRGGVRSYPVPILVSRSVNDTGREQTFPSAQPFLHKSATVSVDIADIADVLENTHEILEMRNGEIIVLSYQDILSMYLQQARFFAAKVFNISPYSD